MREVSRWDMLNFYPVENNLYHHTEEKKVVTNSIEETTIIKVNSCFRKLTHQMRKFYCECYTPFKWGQKRSILVGLSCFFYLHPVIMLRKYILWESYMWLLVTIFSFLSDYLFTGQRESPFARGVHLCDRWIASSALATQIFYNVPNWFYQNICLGIAGSLFILLAILTKIGASTARNPTQYVLWHSLWHAVGAFGRSIQNYLQFVI